MLAVLLLLNGRWAHTIEKAKGFSIYNQKYIFIFHLSMVSYKRRTERILTARHYIPYI